MATAHTRVELIAIPALPDFEAGDDLASLIVAAAAAARIAMVSGDIVVVAQKIVSKCENAFVDLSTVEPSERAREIARITAKDARLVEVILADAAEVLRAREGVLIVAHRNGHVMANAGVDASNLDGSVGERVLRLPVDADASARCLNAGPASEPAPSVRRRAIRLVTPFWPSGSRADPPSKEKERLITGTLLSSTSQALMPSGVVTCLMSIAAAGAIDSTARTAARTAARATRAIIWLCRPASAPR